MMASMKNFGKKKSPTEGRVLPMKTETLVRWGQKYFTLPDKGKKCDCLIGKNYKQCHRVSVISVMGDYYMGIGNYCKKCWDEHCAARYPNLEKLLAVLKMPARPA